MLIVVFFLLSPNAACAQEIVPFQGEGTSEAPYLIQSVEDLEVFRNLVNQGKDFKDVYFMQTEDLDLAGIDWTPIGVYGSGSYFYGTYDGNGHSIWNMNIPLRTDGGVSNQGFFGQLGGKVLNLGIESGKVEGACIGSIASHSAPNSMPVIISCYSKVQLIGDRTGGIVDNFTNGIVINCWYDGNLEGNEKASIASYAGVLINCLNIDGIRNDQGVSTELYSVDSIENFVRIPELNTLWYLYATAIAEPERIMLWEYGNGEIVFSEQRLLSEESIFEGEGTKENPYLIESYEDLCRLRNSVNQGMSYEGQFFCQTADIIMEVSDWVPIGVANSGHYFFGVYDGDGHKIENLSIPAYGADGFLSRGLFGYLGGVVTNLGLENVQISGEQSAAFAAGAAGEFRTAAIVNCYATGMITGNQAAGIAYNFDGGAIVNCISDVVFSEAAAESIGGGIAAYANDTKIYGCYTTTEQILRDVSTWKTCASVNAKELYTETFFHKMNLLTGLAQQLFGNQYEIELKQWDVKNTEGISFSEETFWLMFFDFLNEYLLALLMFAYVVGTLYRGRNKPLEQIWEERHSEISATAIISGIVFFFMICFTVSNFGSMKSLGKICTLVLTGVVFFYHFIIMWKNICNSLKMIRFPKELLGVMLTVFVLELLQFNITPRYDASLYYGSFVRGAELFRGDLFSFIGAFVCWKWAHGTALLIAPLEFFFPGQMTGVYISNIIITEITVVILYHLFMEEFRNISPMSAALSSVLLILCPYQLGMFTYLCLDTHLVYYAIWLLYSYKKDNNLMISFCGFLLCFTKITGMLFYVFFLMTCAIIELYMEYEGHFLCKLKKWWGWKKCIFWTIPAIIYLLTMIYGGYFTIQNFAGSYSPDIFGTKIEAAYYNTLMQSFVWGFRWLFLLLILMALLKCIIRRRDFFGNLKCSKDAYINIASLFGCLAITALLLIYNSNAECPRYTAPMNVAYTLLTPISISILIKGEHWKKNITMLLSGILLIQTYWTIDPSIIMNNVAINTGTNLLYKLAVDEDERVSMSLGTDYGEGYEVVGDIYAYNMEYNYYNDLILEAMKTINPQKEDMFYVVDIYDYEFHLNGMQYPIYWNRRTQKMSYDGYDQDSFLLKETNITTIELCDQLLSGQFTDNEFYLLTPARVDIESLTDVLNVKNYSLKKEYYFDNIYGAMSIRHYYKIEGK